MRSARNDQIECRRSLVVLVTRRGNPEMLKIASCLNAEDVKNGGLIRKHLTMDAQFDHLEYWLDSQASARSRFREVWPHPVSGHNGLTIPQAKV